MESKRRSKEKEPNSSARLCGREGPEEGIQYAYNSSFSQSPVGCYKEPSVNRSNGIFFKYIRRLNTRITLLVPHLYFSHTYVIQAKSHS